MLLGIKFLILLAVTVCGASVFAEKIRIEKVSIPAAHGMYVHADGRIWLADTFSNLGTPSAIYDQSGKIVSAMASASGVGIGGISKHPSRDTFSFCDTRGSEIFWMDSKGSKIAAFSVALPWNARWSPSGESLFVVTHGGSVVLIHKDGSQSEILKNLDAPFDIAPIDENSFWVSEQGVGEGRVCLFKKNKTSNRYRKQICNKSYALDNPEGLWPLKDGSVAAVDTGAGTLVKISSDGKTTEVSKNLGIPILLQVFEDGRWVVFTNQSKVGPAMLFGQSNDLQ